MEANNNNNNNVNNNNGGEGVRDPLVNVRDRLFHTLFFRLSHPYIWSPVWQPMQFCFRLSLAYARAVPKQLRRLLECFLLLKAVLAMLLLVYIHLVYTRCVLPLPNLQNIKEDKTCVLFTLHLSSGNQSSVLSMSLAHGPGRGFSGLRLFAHLLTPTPFRCPTYHFQV